MRIVAETEWQQERAEYWAAIIPHTTGYRERKARGVSHPIYDFLFSYYTLSSKKLEAWHPGYGRILEIKDETKATKLVENPHYIKTRDISGLSIRSSLSKLRERDHKQLKWVHSLCNSITQRSPRFSCFGLHEWAFVYKNTEVRHPYPLRLTEEERNKFLECSTVSCSHFDAFRFFPKEASGLNLIRPTADTRLLHEQGGCLHTNMDLYKWSFKLLPWVSSKLVKECFLLAVKAREIDMRASPYDLSSLGFLPIKIETQGGKEEYIEAQKEIAFTASILRERLVKQIELIWNGLDLTPYS